MRALFLLVNQGRPDFAYADQMTPEFKDFINLCNKMKPAERPTAQEALKHKFLEKLAPSSELADLAPTAKQFSEQEVYNQVFSNFKSQQSKFNAQTPLKTKNHRNKKELQENKRKKRKEKEWKKRNNGCWLFSEKFLFCFIFLSFLCNFWFYVL